MKRTGKGRGKANIDVNDLWNAWVEIGAKKKGKRMDVEKLAQVACEAWERQAEIAHPTWPVRYMPWWGMKGSDKECWRAVARAVIGAESGETGERLSK